MQFVTSWEREGIKKGRQVGLQEAQEQIAINLLREGLSVELTVRATGLNLARVQELQAQLQREN